MKRVHIIVFLFLVSFMGNNAVSNGAGDLWGFPEWLGFFKARWEELQRGSREWTQMSFKALKNLGSELASGELPRDYKLYCPQLRHANAEEIESFYVYLLSAIAQLESNFDPRLSYRENFKDSRGNYVVSRGLLQLSLESSRGYKCSFRNEEEIHDPELNLRCGVRIINHWVARDALIGSHTASGFRGASRYWAALRGEKGERIREWTKNFCEDYII